MLTAPALTLLFLCVVVGLAMAFVWMFWEIEQARPTRNWIAADRPAAPLAGWKKNDRAAG